MCGITGIISRYNLNENDITSVNDMSSSLYHRGPDAEGHYRSNNMMMSMRRLSIIDLNNGYQPFYSNDGKLVLIANGEIYNYVELSESLRAKGYSFKTNSDCECIVHLYSEYGKRCVEHLRGMFAFAIWDENKQILFLARDRMGEKALFIHQTSDKLIFSSEMKSLMRSGQVNSNLNLEAINLFFHYQYIPEPLTGIDSVKKLPAGHYLSLDLKTWQLTQSQYWDILDASPIEHSKPEFLIRQQIEDVGKLITRSDVPVGVALSGGLDSSAILALAAKTSREKPTAFTIGYQGRPSCDERNDAKALAQHLKLPFYEMEISTDDMVDFFPELNYWRDEPIADISGHNYHAVMKLAHQHGVKVMMQGQGGDELFWGYPWLQNSLKESRQRAQLFNFTGKAEKAPLSFYQHVPEYSFARQNLNNLYTPQFQSSLTTSPEDIHTFSLPWQDLELKITKLICNGYLLGNGINHGDRLSMANSVELRLPFLDYKFIETVIGLRKCNPDGDLKPKKWLKTALEPLLPEWVINRPKRGFTPPMRDWLEALIQRYGSCLKEGILVSEGIFSEEAIEKILTSKEMMMRCLAFKALVFEKWWKNIIIDQSKHA